MIEVAGYGVFDQTVEDGTIHVVPLIGPEHVCSETCWCHPEPDNDQPELIVHNVAH